MLHIKDLDIEILKRIENLDNLYLVNKEFNSLIHEEKFWISRFFYKFGDYLKDVDVNKYRNNKTWREYGMEIERKLSSRFLYYISAISLENERYDVLTLLERVKQIENVKEVVINDCKFYSRDGNVDGIKEGKFITRYGEMRKEEIYINDKIKKRKTFKCNKLTKSEEIREFSFKNVTNYFANGKIKSTGDYFGNKKHGRWLLYDKKGNEIKEDWDEGRLLFSNRKF